MIIFNVIRFSRTKRCCSFLLFIASVVVLAACGSKSIDRKNLPTKTATPTSITSHNYGEIESPDNQRPNKIKPPIKILTIDGGGIRGLIPAIILEQMEIDLKKRIHKIFDINGGTSTGALISLLLACPNKGKDGPLMTAYEIKRLYIEDGKKIFKSSCSAPALICGINGPRYDVSSLEQIIRNLVKSRLFSEALIPTIVTVFDIEANHGKLLESDLSEYGHLTIFEVARATSAAPTYFAPKMVLLKTPNGGTKNHFLVDGGLYRNNPARLAYLKAIDKFGAKEIKERGIILISLGTGKGIINPHDGYTLQSAGYSKWISTIIDAMIEGASNEDHKLLENTFKSIPSPSAYIRIQTRLNNLDYPDIVDLDNVSDENIRLLEEAANNSIKSDEYKQAIEMLTHS